MGQALSMAAGSGVNFMSGQIISLHEWFETPPGRYLLAWERARFDRAVADIFGYHALQLGLPELDALAANRMPHRWLATGEPGGWAGMTASAASRSAPPDRQTRCRRPHPDGWRPP